MKFGLCDKSFVYVYFALVYSLFFWGWSFAGRGDQEGESTLLQSKKKIKQNFEMPFFDADKFTVGVQVDSHHAAIVGGSIAGTLTIDCAEESSLRTITMKYRVKEYRLRAPRHMEVTATEAKSLGFQYKAKMHSVEYVMLGGSDKP